jgi:hypothetical protein
MVGTPGRSRLGAGLRPNWDSRRRLSPQEECIKAVSSAAFCCSDFFSDQSNAQNYERRMPVGHLFAAGSR